MKKINIDNQFYIYRVGCPNILNRSSWTTRLPKALQNFTTLPITHIVIRQLEGFKTINNQQECIKGMKYIQDIQIDKRGWVDIGYNFLLCHDDNGQQQIYRGRGWTHVGAHCIGYNHRSLGKFSFLRTYQK